MNIEAKSPKTKLLEHMLKSIKELNEIYNNVACIAFGGYNISAHDAREALGERL